MQSTGPLGCELFISRLIVIVMCVGERMVDIACRRATIWARKVVIRSYSGGSRISERGGSTIKIFQV